MLSSIIDQAPSRGDHVLLHDPKDDYTASLSPRDIVLLGPWDARAAMWDVSADMDSPPTRKSLHASLSAMAVAAGITHFLWLRAIVARCPGVLTRPVRKRD
ncbi:MAG: type IV secretion system DNA-binding domain-containing protein [Thiomonas sp.]